MPLRSTPAAIAWHLLLLTLGSVLFAIGINGAVVHNSFITGGVCGAALLLWYKTSLLSPPARYLLFSILPELKKLESTVFSVDEHTLFVVENSFNVIGSNSGKRKMY